MAGVVGPRTVGGGTTLALVGLLVTAVLAACGPNEHRGPVRLTTALAVGPAELELEVPSCNGHAEVTELRESDAEVVVEVTSTTYREGDDCLDSIRVTLEQPLGDRRLVDATSGDEIAVDDARAPGA